MANDDPSSMSQYDASAAVLYSYNSIVLTDRMLMTVNLASFGLKLGFKSSNCSLHCSHATAAIDYFAMRHATQQVYSHDDSVHCLQMELVGRFWKLLYRF